MFDRGVGEFGKLFEDNFEESIVMNGEGLEDTGDDRVVVDVEGGVDIVVDI